MTTREKHKAVSLRCKKIPATMEVDHGADCLAISVLRGEALLARGTRSPSWHSNLSRTGQEVSRRNTRPRAVVAWCAGEEGFVGQQLFGVPNNLGLQGTDKSRGAFRKRPGKPGNRRTGKSIRWSLSGYANRGTQALHA